MKRGVEPRYTVRFNDGEYATEHPLPQARAERIALAGIGDQGAFQGGHAELIDADTGESVLTLALA